MNTPNWKSLFVAWPSEQPRRGVLVTTFGEQIPFTGYLTGEEFLFVERQAPDSMGGRALLLPYQNIAAVKFTDVVKEKGIQGLGFQGQLPKK